LLTVLLLTLAVAVACAVLFKFSDAWAGPSLALLLVAVPGVLSVAALQSRGGLRAFCVGALFPTVPVLLALGLWLMFVIGDPAPRPYGPSKPDWIELAEHMGQGLRPIAGGSWVASILSGGLSVGAWWILDRDRRSRGG